MQRGLPDFIRCRNTAKVWAVIGGGPSINDCVAEIRELKRKGAAVVSVNKSHDWCLENGIVPWGHVMIDPMEWVADYVKRPRHDVRYFIGSQCHGSVFDALKGRQIYVVHGGQDFGDDIEPREYLTAFWPNSDWTVIPGPTTVGLRTPLIGHCLGADEFHLFGLDSSRSAGKLHGYAKTEAPDATSGMQSLAYRGHVYKFDTNSHMQRQIVDFDEMIEGLPRNYETGVLRKGFSLVVHGSGLLPFYAAMLGLHADDRCNENAELVGGFTEKIANTPNLSAGPWTNQIQPNA